MTKYLIHRNVLVDTLYYMNNYALTRCGDLRRTIPDYGDVSYNMTTAINGLRENHPIFMEWFVNKVLPVAIAIDPPEGYLSLGEPNPERRTLKGWLNSTPVLQGRPRNANPLPVTVGQVLTRPMIEERAQALLASSPWLASTGVEDSYSGVRIRGLINRQFFTGIEARVAGTMSPIPGNTFELVDYNSLIFDSEEGTIGFLLASDEEWYVDGPNRDSHFTESFVRGSVASQTSTYRATVLSRLNRPVQDDTIPGWKKDEMDIARARKYETFRRSVPKVEDRSVFSALPTLPTGTAASCRWGIEVESGAASGISAPGQWDRKYDGSLSSAYDGGYRDYDEDYYDDDEDYYGESSSDDCAEFVSPILNSFHSAGLRKIMEAHNGRPVTDTAGIHVHVDAADLTVKQVAELVASYDLIEPIIEASYQREEREYCKRRRAEETLRVLRDGKNPAKRNQLATRASITHGDRYVTVNLCALSHHGTVEFRAMGPVYDYEYVIRWAMFCREMVNTIRNGATRRQWRKVKDFAGVMAMFAKYGTEYKVAVMPALEEQFEQELVSA